MKIRLEHVGKSFSLSRNVRYAVLDDICLTVEHGDFVAVLGESGSGKSTLLNLVAGLLPPTSGEIWAEEKDGSPVPVTGPHPSRSILFQQPSLLPWLSVEENIDFGCKLRGDCGELGYRVHQFIEMMGLAGFHDVHPAELSLGMAHRVCLARALIGRPSLLLLDEPFSALDTFNRTHLQEELINIWLSEQFSALFVTHDIEEAVLMANRVVILGGRPSRIHGIFEIGLAYPRDIASEEFFKTRTAILRRFKEVFAGK